MGSIVSIVAETGYTFISPAADSFISGQFVGIEQLADKACRTTIQTVTILQLPFAMMELHASKTIGRGSRL